MKNQYEPKLVVIEKIERQTPDVKLFTLRLKNKKDQANFSFVPGQFAEVGLPGFGEGPFGLCSDSREAGKSFQVCIRDVGSLTSQLHKLKKGDLVSFRGPLGNGFTGVSGRNLLLIGGGVGIVPLRTLILEAECKKDSKVQVFYGAGCLEELLFQKEFKLWQKKVDFCVTIDKKCSGWRGHVGLITTLFDDMKVIKDAVVIMCGPPMMYKFVIDKLKEYNIPDHDIFLLFERKMHCGIGVCQHCAIGSKYVCTDGPVFSLEELKDIDPRPY